MATKREENERKGMKKCGFAVGLIAVMAIVLVLLNRLCPDTSWKYLEPALDYNHDLLLILAAEAVLIAFLTSGVKDKKVPTIAAATAALIIFADTTNQVSPANLPEVLIVLAVTIPIGIAIFGIIQLPKDTDETEGKKEDETAGN